MKTALENLIVVLKDENTISPYEMCSSGLVQALFTVLNNVSVALRLLLHLQCVSRTSLSVFSCGQSVDLDLKHDCKPLMERINVFKAAFSENEDNERYTHKHTHTVCRDLPD